MWPIIIKQKIQRFKYSPQLYSLEIHDTSLKNQKKLANHKF